MFDIHVMHVMPIYLHTKLECFVDADSLANIHQELKATPINQREINSSVYSNRINRQKKIRKIQASA